MIMTTGRKGGWMSIATEPFSNHASDAHLHPLTTTNILTIIPTHRPKFVVMIGDGVGLRGAGALPFTGIARFTRLALTRSLASGETVLLQTVDNVGTLVPPSIASMDPHPLLHLLLAPLYPLFTLGRVIPAEKKICLMRLMNRSLKLLSIF
jgi:hypothetical protein